MGKYKSLPKQPDGTIDKLKVRQEYLQNPHYKWTQFCELSRYKPNSRVNFPISQWQQEWIHAQFEVQDDEHTQEEIDLSLNLRRSRIYAAKAWLRRLEALRGLYEKSLNQRLDRVKDGVEPAPDARELAQWAFTEKTIVNTELRSLGLLKGYQDVSTRINALREHNSKASHAQNQSDIELDRLINTPISVMGCEGLSADKVAKELVKWFDQLNQPSPDTPDPNDHEQSE